MLATPRASDWKDVGVSNQPDVNRAVQLLPTPRTSDTNGAGQHGDGGLDLRTAVTDLLPTPKAHDGEFATPRTSGRPIEKSTHLQTIASLDGPTHWGKYAPAIHRWGTLTRPAPPPAEPNRNNKPRLNPAFSEWMMGWPEGWVTDLVGRNDALRIIGNGVVPQQAVAALQWLLSVSEVAA